MGLVLCSAGSAWYEPCTCMSGSRDRQSLCCWRLEEGQLLSGVSSQITITKCTVYLFIVPSNLKRRISTLLDCYVGTCILIALYLERGCHLRHTLTL